MYIERLSLRLLFGLCCIVPILVHAHHSVRPGSYEKELVGVDATVVKFKYANPHGRLQFDITNKNGEIEHWSTIMHSINTLRRKGIEPDVMGPGDKVKVFGWPSRYDNRFMRVKEIELTDKRMARFWGPDMGVYASNTAQATNKDVQSSTLLKQDFNFAGSAPENFAGLWTRAFFGDRPGEPPFNDKATALMADFDPAVDDPVLNCTEWGYPRSAGNPYPVEIIHHPDMIYMLYETDNTIRRIYLDGRDFPSGYPDSKNGYSIAKWEGKELVITTKKLESNVITGLGTPMSKNAVITERWTSVDPEQYAAVDSPTRRVEKTKHQKLLKTDIFIDDPEYYSEPFLFKRAYYSYKPDLVLLEYLCDPENSNSR